MSEGFVNYEKRFNAVVESTQSMGEMLQAVFAQTRSELIGHGWPEHYAEQAGYEHALFLLRSMGVNRG
ncbi:hypothetical protein [Corynebacterium coyleae]|uniref:hypothetical protein n=1 Tax=Corynebacterium coyleae TaxID=53374 RepID=UPI00254A2DA8|nr:hypothetical protein [Corynebacterium coyleae]MDK8242533.1 hypothetical protein [Corynebacterium coyleae]